jgi:hypothetical protein
MKKVFLIICAFFCAVLVPGMLLAGTAPTLEVLNPSRGSDVEYGSSVVIAVSIYDVEGDTDIREIELKVDNKNVTRQANISALLVTYAIEEVTTPGRHNFSLTVKDKEGNKGEVASYFTVTGKPARERIFTVNGTVKASYDYDDQAAVQHVGTADVYLYGRAFNTVDYAASVMITNAASTDGQRVSNYRLDIYSPIGDAVFGDTTPSFSDYTIDGKSVFGVHLLPQFGSFGLELLYGQSYRAVSDPATLQQTIYGGKLKIGSTEGFLWGLTFLKATDTIDPAINASPQDNVVLGTDFSFNLADGKVLIYAEANESLLNTDITDGASNFLGFDPSGLAWLFVINDHLVPYIPGLSNFAGKAALTLGPFFENTFNAEFSYVGPAYYSLANSAITSDKAGIKAWDTAWLFGRNMYLSLAFQYYWNNLMDTLSYTTNSLGGSGYAYIYATDYLTINTGVNYLASYDASKSYVDLTNVTVDGGVSYGLEVLDTNSTAYVNATGTFATDNVTTSNSASDYSTRLGMISYFNSIPLDTKAVIGYDFGDSPSSFYIEGRVGYWFFPEETVYAYVGADYATGAQLLETEIGANADIPWDVELEAKIEYLTSPSGSNLRIYAGATKTF